MKTTHSGWVSVLVAASVLISPSARAKDEPGRDVTHTKFVAYEGTQNWPTGQAVQVIKSHSVPIYLGLPERPYQILGRIIDDRHGFDEISRGFSEAFSSEDRRMERCANQALLHGGDAVMVTGNEAVVKGLSLSTYDLKHNTPLFEQEDKATLVIRFLAGPHVNEGPPPPPHKPAF